MAQKNNPSNQKNKKQNNDIEQIQERLKNSKLLKVLRVVAAIGLAILLFYAPYFRGLYFAEEMSTTLLYTAIVFLVFIAFKLFSQDFRIFKTPLDYVIAAFLLVYWLPVIFGYAASFQLAYDKFFRHIGYFFIYLMARDLVENSNYLRMLLNAIIISSVGVSILGLDAGTGVVSTNPLVDPGVGAVITNTLNLILAKLPLVLGLKQGAASVMTFVFFGGYTEGRVYSTLQYPNVLASYLGAIFILTTGMLMTSDKIWKRFLYGGAGFIVFYTLVLTASRGMILIFPFVYLLLLAALGRKNIIIDTILYTFFMGLIGLAFSSTYNQFVNNSRYGLMWGAVLGGFILSGCVVCLIPKVNNYFYNISVKIYGVIAASLIVLGIVLGVAALNIEQPLVIQHAVGEKDTQKNVLREVAGIKQNNKYSLEFNVESSVSQPNQQAYVVSVIGVNQFAQLKEIANISGSAEKGLKRIDFTTNPDTIVLRINMNNSISGTSAAFSNLILKDLASGQQRRIVAQYKYLPTDLIYKIKDINLKTHNVWERFQFVKDAFKIIRDNPLFGAGGGAWKALYQKYQSYGYASNEVHNHFVQVWVETGTVGFLILLTIVGLIGYYYFIFRKIWLAHTHSSNFIIGSVVFVSIVSLYLHSVIDFDLSLSAVYLTVWALTGILMGMYLHVKKDDAAFSIPASTIAILVFFIFAITLIVQGTNSISGRVVLGELRQYNVITSKDPDYLSKLSQVAAIYEKYLSYQPLDADKRIKYINTLQYLTEPKASNEEQARVYIDKFQRAWEKYAKDEPVSFNTYMYKANVAASEGKVDESTKLTELAVESQKFQPMAYVRKAEFDISLGQKIIQQGASQNDKQMIVVGKSFIEKAKNINKEIEEVNSKALRPMEITPDERKQIDDVVKSADNLLNQIKI